MEDALKVIKRNLPKSWVKQIAIKTSLSESLVQKTMSGDPKRQNQEVIRAAIYLAKKEAKRKNQHQQELTDALRFFSK